MSEAPPRECGSVSSWSPTAMKLLALRSGLIVLATAALGVAVATPANAATPPTLPSGSSLYAVDCDSAPNQVYSVSTANADATKIGTGTTSGSTCATQAAWDAANHTAYYIRWGDGPDENDALASINLKTGVTTRVGSLHDGGTFFHNGIANSMAIGADGKAYVFVLAARGTQVLYSLDLSDGSMTEVGPSPDPVSISDFNDAFSYDPKDGNFYAIDGNGNILSVNVTTGVQTLVLSLSVVVDSEVTVNSLQIDSNGVFWYEQDGDGTANIFSITPSDTTSDVFSGTVSTADPDGVSRDDFYTESLLIAPTQTAATNPTLPTTGVNGQADAAGGLGAAAAVLVGISLLVGVSIRRLRRHSTTG